VVEYYSPQWTAEQDALPPAQAQKKPNPDMEAIDKSEIS
jgi:hypothetical protein